MESHSAHTPIELITIIHVSIKLLLQVAAAFLNGDYPSSWRVYDNFVG